MKRTMSGSSAPGTQEITRPRLVLFLGLLVIWGAVELLAFGLTVGLNSSLTQPILARGTVVSHHRNGLRELVQAPDPRAQFDTLLGWSYRPSFARGGDTINSQGLRSAREYGPRTGQRRVAAFGDSFVYCVEVANPDCWLRRLEGGYPVEALNYGVGGYGVDQAFLRYLREGDDLDPDIVLIGFAPVDLGRTVNRYRGFISPLEGPWFKPRFYRSGPGLVLMETPAGTPGEAESLLSTIQGIRQAGDGDYWYRPALYENPLYLVSPVFRLASEAWLRVSRRSLDPDRLYVDGVFNTSSEAFQIQARLLRSFVDSVAADGFEPLVVMLPGGEDLRRTAAASPPTYAPLLETLGAERIPVFDPAGEILAAGGDISSLFAAGGHYSPRGNALLAGAVARRLQVVAP